MFEYIYIYIYFDTMRLVEREYGLLYEAGRVTEEFASDNTIAIMVFPSVYLIYAKTCVDIHFLFGGVPDSSQ